MYNPEAIETENASIASAIAIPNVDMMSIAITQKIILNIFQH